MRTIKFRVWNKLQNRWQDKLCLYLDDSKIGDASDCFHNQEDEDNYVLCQYTGLKDKNGREIYEGDILRSELSREELLWSSGMGIPSEYYYDGVVHYKNGAFRFEGDDFSLVSDENKHALIIGNIFEHKNLLK